METKHTQGKWTPKLRPDNQWFVFSERALTVASIGKWSVKSEAEAEANAYLIAAAPKLLEALQDVMKDIAPHFYKMGTKKAFHELVVLAQAGTAIYNATKHTSNE